MATEAYPPIGQVWEVRFGDQAFHLDFAANGREMTYTHVGDGEAVAVPQATVHYTAVPIRPGVFMVHWIEPDGATVTHVEDFENGVVHTNITLTDLKFLNLSGPMRRVR
jgi:hypothetical protein